MAATALQQLAGATRPIALAEDQLLSVVPGLAGLLPGGGLRRGSTVSIAPGPASVSLALALLAGPSAAGSWCAAVGLADLGLVVAAEAGVVLERFPLVADPGRDWPVVVAALLDALDVVLVRPPAYALRPADGRRLVARARERGAVLLIDGQWPGADVRLSVESSRWDGLGQGFGHLGERRLVVSSTGRGAASRPRRVEVRL